MTETRIRTEVALLTHYFSDQFSGEFTHLLSNRSAAITLISFIFSFLREDHPDLVPNEVAVEIHDTIDKQTSPFGTEQLDTIYFLAVRKVLEEANGDLIADISDNVFTQATLATIHEMKSLQK